MKIRTAYLGIIFAFYLSIPVFWNGAKIAILLKGYSPHIALKEFDVSNGEMIGLYYDAYRDSFPIVRYIAWICAAIWIITFISSASVVWRRFFGRQIIAPYKLDIITTVISLCVIGLAILAGLIFGNGWPMGLL